MRTNHINPVFPRLFGEAFDSLFNTTISDIIGSDFNLTSPAINVKEDDDHFVLEMAAPGLTKKDFNIEIEKEHLKISSNKEEDESEDKVNYKRREFNYTKFVRSFQLPETVDKTNISAEYKNGILKLKLAKLDHAIDKGPKKISIS